MKTYRVALLALAVSISAFVHSQGSAPAAARSNAQLLVSARKVALIGDVGHVAQLGVALNPSAEKAQKILEKEVRNWGRFIVITDPIRADLVLVLWEGNRPAGGGGVIRTARLAVLPGGRPPKRGDLPLWEEDASGSIFATSGAPKVIGAFRAYLEKLEKTVPKIVIGGKVSATTGTGAESVGPPGGSTQATTSSAGPTQIESRPEKYISPLEVIAGAKTFTLRGKGAAGEQGTFDRIFGVGEYSNIQSAMHQVHQLMAASGKVEFVEEVPKADLVILVYQWDTRVYSKQFHGVRTAIQIAEGREAFRRDDPALWVSGTVKGSVQELLDSLRLDLEQAASVQTLQATHTGNTSYARACDWMESAGKKDGSQRSDLLFEAVAELRKSLQENYGYAPTHERLGTALRELGFHSNAAYEYKLALRLQPGMQEALHGLLTTLTKIRDYDEAVLIARDVVRSVPQRADSYLALGDVEFSRKSFSEAADAYQQAIARDSTSALAHEKLGRALYRARRMSEAESAFRDALRLAPSGPDIQLWLGSTLNELQRRQEAAELLKGLVASDPTNGSAHFELGRSFRALQQYDQAIAEFNQAISVDPRALTFHIELAHTLEGAGKNEQALSKYQEIVLNAPNSADARVDLAAMLLKRSHLQDALHESEEAVRLDDSCARAYQQLGRAREAKGDTAGADSRWTRRELFL